jgi:hypothetical protein
MIKVLFELLPNTRQVLVIRANVDVVTTLLTVAQADHGYMASAAIQ